MAKLTSEEIIKKYTEGEKNVFAGNDDLAIEFMEDVSDSVKADNQAEIDGLKADVERLTTELYDMKERYKARFLSGDPELEAKVEEIVEEKVDDELKEEEVIDVKEI